VGDVAAGSLACPPVPPPLLSVTKPAAPPGAVPAAKSSESQAVGELVNSIRLLTPYTDPSPRALYSYSRRSVGLLLGESPLGRGKRTSVSRSFALT
jgi:hypothetical protein